MFSIRVFAWFMLCLAFCEAGLYTKSRVRELNAQNFKEKVVSNDRVSVVEFYAPWCGHCKSLAPQYKKSASSLSGLVNVYAVNCDEPMNKKLCASQKIKGFPTIKVFQPGKKTDMDLKDMFEGLPIKPKKPRVFTYTGPRDTQSINKFAISKLRNYAGTLAHQQSFYWLKPNLVPRVLMLPGSKYKSKSIAPLWKVLSNEYFGKMRFGYVPRRIDGAWNLLGLKAAEESQIVYMSDDHQPLVYQGALTKSAVKKFLNEQYDLEMSRRANKGIATYPSREDAAFGMEWTIEDKQIEELEHVRLAKLEQQDDYLMLEESKHNAREKLRKERAEEAGETFVPREFNRTEMIQKFLNPEVEDVPEAAAIVIAAGAGADRINATDVDMGEEFTDFEADDEAESDDEISIKVAQDANDISDAEAQAEDLESNIDDGDVAEDSLDKVEDAPELVHDSEDSEASEEPETEDEDYNEDDEDSILDIVDIELLPEDIVQEGPSAISKYRDFLYASKSKLDSERLAREAKRTVEPAAKGVTGITTPQQKTVTVARPGITPEAQKKSEDEEKKSEDLVGIDAIVANCIRAHKTCILVATSEEFSQDDKKALLLARNHLPGNANARLLYNYFIDDNNEEHAEIAADLGYSPYTWSRGSKTNPGERRHTGKVAIFDAQKGKMYMSDTEYTANNIMRFIVKYFEKGLTGTNIPKKYRFHVSQEEIEYLDKLEEAKEEL